jgi:hypothetical protein
MQWTAVTSTRIEVQKVTFPRVQTMSAFTSISDCYLQI